MKIMESHNCRHPEGTQKKKDINDNDIAAAANDDNSGGGFVRDVEIFDGDNKKAMSFSSRNRWVAIMSMF